MRLAVRKLRSRGGLISENPELSRCALSKKVLSKEVFEAWQWKQANGELRDWCAAARCSCWSVRVRSSCLGHAAVHRTDQRDQRVRIGNPAGLSHSAIMSEHASIQRIKSRIVDVGFKNAFAQVVGHDDLHRTAELAERNALVQLGPDARARLKGEQPNAFAAVTKRQHVQVRAAVFATNRIADRGAGAVIDVRFFAGCNGDDGAWSGGTGARSLRTKRFTLS